MNARTFSCPERMTSASGGEACYGRGFRDDSVLPQASGMDLQHRHRPGQGRHRIKIGPALERAFVSLPVPPVFPILGVSMRARSSLAAVIAEIDIWRVAYMMLRWYGNEAQE